LGGLGATILTLIGLFLWDQEKRQTQS
jgi:hypothetical protein